MKKDLTTKALRSTFKALVEKLSGENVSSCTQCGKCSAGCPPTPDNQTGPSQVMRMIQLGLTEETLTADAVWCCTGCSTCTSRCPMGIDVATILDASREIAEQRDTPLPEVCAKVRMFHRSFLDSVQKYGRLSETALMGAYNTNSGRLWTNMAKAPQFLLRGKIRFRPHAIKNIDRLQRVFERTERMTKEEIDGIEEQLAKEIDSE